MCKNKKKGKILIDPHGKCTTTRKMIKKDSLVSFICFPLLNLHHERLIQTVHLWFMSILCILYSRVVWYAYSRRFQLQCCWCTLHFVQILWWGTLLWSCTLTASNFFARYFPWRVCITINLLEPILSQNIILNTAKLIVPEDFDNPFGS